MRLALRLSRRMFLALLFAGSACDEPETAYRGPNLEPAAQPVSDVVAIYRAAATGSFPIDNPDLSILIDPLFLPRGPGLAGGDSIPADLMQGLRAAPWVKGNCSIPVTPQRDPLRCPAARAGYVLRFSPPFAIGQDSVQVYMAVQQYALPDGPAEQRLRFERAYNVVRSGRGWRAVSEARLEQP